MPETTDAIEMNAVMLDILRSRIRRAPSELEGAKAEFEAAMSFFSESAWKALGEDKTGAIDSANLVAKHALAICRYGPTEGLAEVAKLAAL